MHLHLLDDEVWFPPVSEALPDGLLAIGGDLRPERLLLAYRNGIFPWYNDDEPPLWWSPDPRFVLFPDELKVSKSMLQVIRKGEFEFKVDTDFEAVINNCRLLKRKDMDGTWISDDVEDAYTELHKLGYAHSAEAWKEGKLVGGLYGILLGKVFFGESMFSLTANASKFAFIKWVQELKARGIVLIDCQVYTEHLESLGARMIPREQFIDTIGKYAG
ncbi:MAG: leucyl/phenylalanyl-tRNA--protein transferase [Flavipsychrobacter sp.]|jgi:leucyl/phenylalanyl-tRNA--protein transferase|nr:leucyl/phenylalanyl-tRNA--protein transferase [Flavipsychrobacter sp.]